MPFAGLDGDGDRISHVVVAALADAADTDPLSLTPPLYEVVDPDALDALARNGTAVRVEFEYDGRSVVVRDGDTVEVDGAVYEA